MGLQSYYFFGPLRITKIAMIPPLDYKYFCIVWIHIIIGDEIAK
jgi:hypothetical protein